ncbi:GntR family transcriptional regulator [Lacticaseibacillus casei]|jgi:GntR family transcriptional regulator|uniref:GntR family transcriptional regulator n=1 Tax=Lacticaseibacillus huelsenbergensis TaxID=3035291 RepID=A0ABY8DR69_9LACO|nr:MULTISPECIES: GntR family transcriptional regulator [Lacticaseibacillus]MDG3060935.1 GntR family transcriptional regulator [Lacticaseibacillus sp. BCRC 81376]QVI37284.1 GntR family transcriptional regulator [Lacticaseibacillus casei]QXG59075.1 GntR family transcriptional regulator [Lacticaseibacillus casei]WFB39475.1 GntR family transcriptional regulator [Lacticaseibacillus huelsenbergensis]WFB41177.1 GntR family transcriptional regulator [Lacticaseibacillus huelsenbergensis]
MKAAKYKQIEADLLRRIQDDQYPIGTLIPKELDLVEMYSVSRPTVRQAIQELVNKGYLEKKKRRGTLVKQKKIAQEFTHRLQSYSQEMGEKGLQPETRVLNLTEETANEEVQKHLEIEKGQKVYKLVRLRYANEEPIVFVTSYIPVDVNSEFLKTDFETTSLYSLLKKSGYAVTRVRRKLEVAVADETIGDMLNVSEGAPIFYFHTQGITDKNRIVEYSISKYRGDLNYFVIDIDQ